MTAFNPNKRIIFLNEDGSVGVITPCDASKTLEQIATKDVPTGRPYKIIDLIDLPDRSQRLAWTVDEADLTDGVGA